MRTARLLAVSPSMHCAGGGVCLGGVSALRGVPASGAGEGCIPACNGADNPPPPTVNRITDTCKNIALPQLRCGR